MARLSDMIRRGESALREKDARPEAEAAPDPAAVEPPAAEDQSGEAEFRNLPRTESPGPTAMKDFPILSQIHNEVGGVYEVVNQINQISAFIQAFTTGEGEVPTLPRAAGPTAAAPTATEPPAAASAAPSPAPEPPAPALANEEEVEVLHNELQTFVQGVMEASQANQPFSVDAGFLLITRVVDMPGASDILYRRAIYVREDNEDHDFTSAVVTHSVNVAVYSLKIIEKDRASVEAEYYRSLARNIELLDALQEIDRSVEHGAFLLMALKGAALAETVYGDPGLRPMNDLDLLVRSDDEGSARELLRSLGYRPAGLYGDIYRRGRIVVDLHTDAINRSRIQMRGQALHVDTGDLFARSRPLASYSSVVGPDPVDHLLVLCIHAFKHGFRRRIWLVDIAEVVGRLTGGQCRSVQGRFESARAMPILDLSRWMLRHHLGYRWPGCAVFTASRELGLPPWFLELAVSRALPQILEPIVTLRILKGTSSRVRYLLEAAFPQRQVLAQISDLDGRWTFWLSYPYRCMQLLLMAVQVARQALVASNRQSDAHAS